VAQPPHGGPANAGPVPVEAGRESDRIGESIQAPAAAPSVPAGDKLALRLQMRPPLLDNVPMDQLSPGVRQVLHAKPRGITVTEAIQLFDELKTLGYGNEFDKEQSGDPVAGRNWVRDSSSKTRFALQFWPEFVGDGPFEEADKGAVRDALEVLPRIPKKHGKGVQDWGPQHSFEDLIERSDAWEEHMAAANLACLSRDATEADREKAVLKAREPRLRAETVIKHRRHMKAVGEMLLALQLIDTNPFLACAVTGKQEDRMKMAEEGRTRTVWDDRIHDLFRTPAFQGGLEDAGDPLFWAPLIARFMGLRQEEILQLAPDDFLRDGGIDLVDIKRWEGNHVKSKASERRVPIHPILIELGLLKLVELRRTQDQSRLFPHLKRGAVKGKFSEVFTKTFTRYRQDHDVYWPGLDFHAFRTTCNGDLMNQDKSDAVRCAIMGHEFKDEGGRSYSQGLGLRTAYERICDVTVDVSMIVSPFHGPEEKATTRASRSGLRVVA
jgi:integrase